MVTEPAVSLGARSGEYEAYGGQNGLHKLRSQSGRKAVKVNLSKVRTKPTPHVGEVLQMKESGCG